MQLIDILVPQLGEGLQEARIVKFLKEPGETVQRDEPLYQIETDKAVMEIESPHTGTLHEWLVNEEEVIPVGSPIARLQTQAARGQKGDKAVVAGDMSPARLRVTKPARRLIIPPRTRAYCRKAGISPDEMECIPAQNGKKLMPSDVDRYLAARSEAVTTSGYQDHLLTSQQRILVHRLKRSAQLVVPATLTYQLDWQALKRTQKELGEEYPETYPSEFETLAYSVAQATINYPRFRSTLVADDMVREYEHLNLGVAVHCPNDELVTAVMSNADTLDFPDFVRMARQQVSAALNGDDQATESTQFLLTYMVDYQIVAANPILVAPAIAILFVGPLSAGRWLTLEPDDHL